MSIGYNLINGHFYTGRDDLSDVENITISKGKIVGINSHRDDFETIDLNGLYVYPGFVDAHCHIKNYGRYLATIPLKDSNNIDEIIDMLKPMIDQAKPGEVIEGTGWDQEKWPTQDFPETHILDSIAPNNPVILSRVDGHAIWVNQRAKEIVGKHSHESNDGGSIINGCVFVDNAKKPFSDFLNQENAQYTAKWIQIAQNKFIEMGITGVHDAWQDEIIFKTIQSLEQDEQFFIRCYGMLSSYDLKFLKSIMKAGHYISPYYSARSVKVFLDGALGSRGALLFEEYSDDPCNCGLQLMPESQLIDLAKLCYQHNYQLNTHAIGDRANRIVLDTYKQVLQSDKTHRWRVEHAQMLKQSDLIKFSQTGIIPSMQPSHCTGDMPWLDNRLGTHRTHRISRWKSLIDSGVIIPGGSDCPYVGDGNPLFELYAAVTRKAHGSKSQSGWYESEAVSREDAIKMFTCWAAYAGFQEHRRGFIFPGFDADLTILSNDLIQCEEEDILNTEAVMTIINGHIRYNQIS